MMIVETMVRGPRLGGVDLEMPGHFIVRWWLPMRDKGLIDMQADSPVLLA